MCAKQKLSGSFPKIGEEYVRVQVFVSSTFKDFKKERDELFARLLQLSWVKIPPEMMDNNLPIDKEPIKNCLKLVMESQVYILIVNHRYGSIPNGDTISVTHQEYRCSKEHYLFKII